MMRTVVMRFASSLKPDYIVSLSRLFSTSSRQLVMDPDTQSYTNKSNTSRPEQQKKVQESQHLVHETHQDQTNYENDVKNKILDASLQFVPVHGWSKDAISAGAETLGYPGVIHGMFPRGGFDLIQHFYIISNKRLVDFLVKEYQAAPLDDKKSESGSGRHKIEKAVRVRLEMIEPYVKQWPQALAIMSLPPNVPTSLANLLCLVDDIFYHTGDRSVDLSWYGRRVVLAGIYKSTELYMLQDNSVEHVNTWEFLHRRMDEADQFRSYIDASGQATQVAKEFATSTFITARSILGLSWNR